MVWAEPTRDVGVPRGQAQRLSDAGRLFCVWSGKKISISAADVDHCFPWSAWPCGDLWNLLPAARKVNQQEKKAKLPSDRILNSARARFIDWWGEAYLLSTTFSAIVSGWKLRQTFLQSPPGPITTATFRSSVFPEIEAKNRPAST